MTADAVITTPLSSNWERLKAKLGEREDSVSLIARSADRNGVNKRRRMQSINTDKNQDGAQQSADTARREPKIGESTASPAQNLIRWAQEHDIPKKSIAEAYGSSQHLDICLPARTHEDRINEGSAQGIDAGKYVAIDCEMVGVGPDPDRESALARVSLVNYLGEQLYDSFVMPKERVTDYRTKVSGITPQLLEAARSLEEVQRDVCAVVKDRVLIGHALKHDLSALLLGHPQRDVRDTSKHPLYRQFANGRTPGLKKLAKEKLGIEIQSGEHSSIEDARTTMMLFRADKENFDKEHIRRWGVDRRLGNAQANQDTSTSSQKKSKKKKKKTKSRNR